MIFSIGGWQGCAVQHAHVAPHCGTAGQADWPMHACVLTDRVFVCCTLRCCLLLAEKQTDCAYQEVKDVRVVSRGLGAWGDMVIELKNGDKLELRSLEK